MLVYTVATLNMLIYCVYCGNTYNVGLYTVATLTMLWQHLTYLYIVYIVETLTMLVYTVATTPMMSIVPQTGNDVTVETCEKPCTVFDGQKDTTLPGRKALSYSW